jgi:hypothetical protein
MILESNPPKTITFYVVNFYFSFIEIYQMLLNNCYTNSQKKGIVYSSNMLNVTLYAMLIFFELWYFWINQCIWVYNIPPFSLYVNVVKIVEKMATFWPLWQSWYNPYEWKISEKDYVEHVFKCMWLLEFHSRTEASTHNHYQPNSLIKYERSPSFRESVHIRPAAVGTTHKQMSSRII